MTNLQKTAKKTAQKSIKERVLEAQAELKAMDTHQKLREWATYQEMNAGASFYYFKKALECIGIDYDLMKGEEEIPKSIALRNFLKKHWCFRYDEIGNCVEYRKINECSWSRCDEVEVWNAASDENFSITVQYLTNVIMGKRTAPTYNPIKGWLEGLQATSNLFTPFEEFCALINLASFECPQRFQKNLIKWFVGAVKNFYEPSYVHKQALIFQGPSGIGKTPFCSSLLPEDMRSRFISRNPVMDPRFGNGLQKLTSFPLIIIDEIDDFFKEPTNRNNYKSFMSTDYVNERLPYGKTFVDRPRISAIVGTCNESTFLNDPTGTQRFSVFSVKSFQNEKTTGKRCIEDFDINALWAVAYKLYKQGYDPQYSNDEIIQNEEFNERYKYNSPEDETITDFVEKPQNEEDGEFYTSTSLCSYLNGKQTDVFFTSNKLGKVLMRMGFSRIQKRISGNPRYGYIVKTLSEKPTMESSIGGDDLPKLIDND